MIGFLESSLANRMELELCNDIQPWWKLTFSQRDGTWEGGWTCDKIVGGYGFELWKSKVEWEDCSTMYIIG